MDNMSNTLQTVMQVQEQYRKVMEPWIKHQEMINQIVNPLGDITGQIQNSLNFRNEWIDTLGLATEIVKPMHSLFEQHAGMIKSLQSVAKTPELLGLQNQLVSNNLFATADYIKDITAVWRVSLKIDDIWQRSIAAQNIAFLRLTPDYRALSLPRGGKKAIRGLTKTAAQRVIQTDDILFDPKDAEYFHKNSPDKKVNANEISVVESSIELFEEISFSDLIAFESQLFDDITFAKEHPVGARIYEIIDGWKEFIDFDMPTYFHARALNDSGQAYLDQEMLKAPQNISGHGRYNDEKNKNSIVNVWPTVYVIDRKGELELNLSRDEVNGNLPFMEELETVLLQKFMQKYREIGEQNKFFISDKMVSSQFNIENYYNQKIMFGKRGYVLFNLFFLERLIKELPITEVVQDNCYGFPSIFNDFSCGKEIRVVRIWTNKNINITRNKMLDDNTYYIFEGIGYHPSLKYRIINHLKDVPFNKSTLYMQRQELKAYQEYPANAHRLSQKFIESNTIKCFEDNNNFVKEVLKLDVEQEDISLAIVYSSNKIQEYNDGSEIFGRYYEEGEKVLQVYIETEPCQ